MKANPKVDPCCQIPVTRTGQSMIEVVIGVGVAALLAVSLITTSLITQKTARDAKNNTQAAKLAQQYIEWIRVIRDRKGFTALLNGPCFVILGGGTTNEPIPGSDPANWSLDSGSCPAGYKVPYNGQDFYRFLSISAGPNPNESLVTANVAWDNHGKTETVSTSTYLSLWSQ